MLTCGHVFTRESIRGIADQQACLTDSTVAHYYNLNAGLQLNGNGGGGDKKQARRNIGRKLLIDVNSVQGPEFASLT